jgi:hypothetical protein
MHRHASPLRLPSAITLPALALLTAGAAAQYQWQAAPGANAQLPRNGAVAYDSGRARIVLFGGQAGAGCLPETWEWDGSRWERRFPAHAPGRCAPALAYDSRRGRTVLWIANPAPATWEWDGADWTLRTPAVQPPPMEDHDLAFDSRRGRTVLFGRAGSPQTWEWDGVSWARRTPVEQPAAGTGHALAYDSGLRCTVLFGGTDGTVPLRDTWEWDGTVWVRRFPGQSPPAATGITLVHDPLRGRTVYAGGGETWEWDGRDWRLRSFVGPTGPGVWVGSRGRALVLADPPQELVVATDVAGAGHPTGSRALAFTGTPTPGAAFTATFASPARLAFLSIGAAPPFRPGLPIGAPFCEPALLYAIPWALIPIGGDPAVALGAFPPAPVLIGQGLCLQGITNELTGCLRATDAMIVTIQP